ncbi:MAG: 16S rRNA processing protein RimM [Rhodobacteraceae bacterium]|nr:16S rRNA processing protein RimM [Paracoccaceae bacterium]
MTDKVCVGAVAGAFGVHGEVRLKSFCADPEAIADYGPLATENGDRVFDVTLGQAIKNGYSARLSGVVTKEDADTLKGVRLYAPRDALPSLPDDEYYHADLIGLAVYDSGGVELGRIKAVMDHGAGDLLEIEGPGLKASVLLPFTQAAVPTVDLTAERVVIDPPEGVFPEGGSDV